MTGNGASIYVKLFECKTNFKYDQLYYCNKDYVDNLTITVPVHFYYLISFYKHYINLNYFIIVLNNSDTFYSLNRSFHKNSINS